MQQIFFLPSRTIRVNTPNAISSCLPGCETRPVCPQAIAMPQPLVESNYLRMDRVMQQLREAFPALEHIIPLDESLDEAHWRRVVTEHVDQSD